MNFLRRGMSMHKREFMTLRMVEKSARLGSLTKEQKKTAVDIMTIGGFGLGYGYSIGGQQLELPPKWQMERHYRHYLASTKL